MSTTKEIEIEHESQNRVRVFFDTFTSDFATFKEKLPRLLEEIPGEYVAIVDGQVIEHNRNWQEVVNITRKRYPDRYVFVEHVVPRTDAEIDMDTLDS